MFFSKRNYRYFKSYFVCVNWNKTYVHVLLAVLSFILQPYVLWAILLKLKTLDSYNNWTCKASLNSIVCQLSVWGMSHDNFWTQQRFLRIKLTMRVHNFTPQILFVFEIDPPRNVRGREEKLWGGEFFNISRILMGYQSTSSLTKILKIMFRIGKIFLLCIEYIITPILRVSFIILSLIHI